MTQRAKCDKQMGRPIVLASNSSSYLLQYRRRLIRSIRDIYGNVVVLSPIDSSTETVAKMSLHIPLKVSRARQIEVIQFLKSVIRVGLLTRALKPKLIHSHTLNTNLLVAFASWWLGVPSVLSFTGLGRLSTSKRSVEKFVFRVTMRCIVTLSNGDLSGNGRRVAYVFQNTRDLKTFKTHNPIVMGIQKVIPGSGVPQLYFDNKYSKGSGWACKENLRGSELTFVYAGRLLKSKGILIIFELARVYKQAKFIIFGDYDTNSPDTITKQELKALLRKYSNIEYKGRVDDPLLTLTYRYPILIVPSNYGEGLPRGVCEAMALRIPIICSRKACCGYFDENTVYVLANSSMGSYIRLIESIMSDKVSGRLAVRLDANRMFAECKLSEAKIVEDTLLLYKEVLV